MSAPTANRPAIGVFTPTRAQIPERTLRTDLWWLPPLLTNLGLLAFICYATTRAFWGSQYWVEKYHYLTPFYSPCVSASCQPGASHLGVWFGHFPGWIPLGAMVLPFLLGFRLTCYYYRKAYYRSVWQSPTSCAVPEPRAHYTGETRLPLIVQNTHRYFFYIAVVVSLINTYIAVVVSLINTYDARRTYPRPHRQTPDHRLKRRRGRKQVTRHAVPHLSRGHQRGRTRAGVHPRGVDLRW